jgi:CspA family cold shock protein
VIGKVRWFDYQKGYGFIESNNKDIYVHYKAIKMHGFRNLKENQGVEFDLVNSKYGLKAHNVHIIKEEIDV